jgi:hypothetical protein
VQIRPDFFACAAHVPPRNPFAHQARRRPGMTSNGVRDAAAPSAGTGVARTTSETTSFSIENSPEHSLEHSGD